jgi:hypothetical protein
MYLVGSDAHWCLNTTGNVKILPVGSWCFTLLIRTAGFNNVAIGTAGSQCNTGSSNTL